MHFHYGAINVHFLLHVGTADRDIVIIWERVIAISLSYTWFSYAGVSEKDDFRLQNSLRLNGIFRPIVNIPLSTLRLDFDAATLLGLFLLFSGAAASFLLILHVFILIFDYFWQSFVFYLRS